MVWKQKENRVLARLPIGLRENHSGMETVTDFSVSIEAKGCVRTIVVWKRGPAPFLLALVLVA